MGSVPPTCRYNWVGYGSVPMCTDVRVPTCMCLPAMPSLHVGIELFFCAHQKMCSCVHYYVKKIHNRLTDKDLHDSSGKLFASEQVCPEGRGKVCREGEGFVWKGGFVGKGRVCRKGEGV